MSIRFNHTANTVTSTGSASIIIEGGTTIAPNPLRLDASSVVFPNKQLPRGESGAVVFDTASKTLKYHDGFTWVELLSKDAINSEVNQQINLINQALNERVSTVTYSTSAVPGATISGTNLNIVFPSSVDAPTDIPGLFTSSPPGSIMQYALTSGQTVADIRQQLSGSGNAITGTGTQSNPYITKTGWCLADGMYWRWNGETIVTKQVPNLNTAAYLKPITTNGVTKTDSSVAGSVTINPTTITMPNHFHGVGQMLTLTGDTADDGSFIYGRTWDDGRTYNSVDIYGDNEVRRTRRVNSTNSNLALSTSNDVYDTDSKTISHTHTASSIDVEHYNVAVLYNIAEPSTALNASAGDARYVLKAGDVMTGSLSIRDSATVQTDATNAVLFFRDGSGSERAAVYHSTTTNTLRLRASGGTEVVISSTGQLTAPSLTVSGNGTISGKNIVRSINNVDADVNGNINLSAAGGIVTNVRRGAEGVSQASHTNNPIRTPTGCTITGVGGPVNVTGDITFRVGQVYYRPIQILVDNVWRTISDV